MCSAKVCSYAAIRVSDQVLKSKRAFGGWTETGGYSARLASLTVLEASQLGAEQDRSDGRMLPRM